MSSVQIEIVDQDGTAVEAIIRTPDADLQAITNVRLDGNTLILYDFHIEGPGPNALGMALLRKIVRRVMELEDVQYLEIHGFRRTTGANPGRTPHTLKFRRR